MSPTLIIPGSIKQLTGGYLFARHVVEHLAQRGEPIKVVELEGIFPAADAVALSAAAQALAALPDGAAAVIDGLSLAGFESALPREAKRLRLVAWVHHALAQETGLDDAERERYRALEALLLPFFRGVICPSRDTANVVTNYGVDPSRIAVTPPGTMKPLSPRAARDTGAVLELLTVATVTPRKGHLVLIDALAQLGRDDWRLHSIGSLTRDPAHVAAVRRAIAAHRLATRITLSDEIPQVQLGAAYEAADLFILPSFLEGYGMAFAEALAYGLPIIGTRAGAIPDTVPEDAAILVPPGDAAALAAALRRLLDDRAYLSRLAEAAALHGAALPDWPRAAAQWRDAVALLLR